MSVTAEASQMSPEDRQVFERHLGEELLPQDHIMILRYRPSVVPDQASRQEALQSIHQILDAARERQRIAGVTEEEFEAAVEEAMNHVRPRHS